MLLGHALVAVLVVARQPGHQLLRVAILDVDQKPSGGAVTQDGGWSTVMRDADLAAAADAMSESLRRIAHDGMRTRSG